MNNAILSLKLTLTSFHLYRPLSVREMTGYEKAQELLKSKTKKIEQIHR